MLSQAAKDKIQAALFPFYEDADFSNVVGDFKVTVESVPDSVPSNDSESVDVIKV